eukprot:6195854-Pleurochrysis_carterae.AAC.3
MHMFVRAYLFACVSRRASSTHFNDPRRQRFVKHHIEAKQLEACACRTDKYSYVHSCLELHRAAQTVRQAGRQAGRQADG